MHSPATLRVLLALVTPRLLLTFLASAVLLSAPAEARESLYEPSRAQRLTSAEQAHFGPRSGRFTYDARMIRAARIAQQRAHSQTTWRCWRYVKNALLAARVIATRPRTAWAKQAGDELCRRFGFSRLNLRDPWQAPIGAVIVYGGADAGHVEMRTASGFVSDFVSLQPYPRPLLGIYVKRS